eukprot:CAMPEP_0168611344 /NCGR_PEP_ID=MMETSP0449_2-20121227/2309_1 /TAXON_ID=1082188 /ORGANISM="Strombidium rassoulzadegani, Strain ras09" /LENGTH=114 /DNA_ID=CAMNT_0008651787 /DNA_START=313 /DNA_END=654 /DNA_ORIENTATION=+
MNDLKLLRERKTSLTSVDLLSQIMIRACRHEMLRSKLSIEAEGLDQSRLYDLSQLEQISVLKCARVHLKYRYKQFLDQDAEGFPIYMGVWHTDTGEITQKNRAALLDQGLLPRP